MSGKIMECMEIDTIYIVLIIGIIIIFVYCIIEIDYTDKMKYMMDNQSNENFIVHTYPKGRSCDQCRSMNRKRCGECINCGYCYNSDGYGECVPGDHTGPRTRKDCVDYEYASPITLDPTTVDDTYNWYYPSWGDGYSQFSGHGHGHGYGHGYGYGWFDHNHNHRDRDGRDEKRRGNKSRIH
jgi:hypothetical protein